MRARQARGRKYKHHAGPTCGQQDAKVEQRIGRFLRGMEHHREQDVDDGRAAEDERHDVEGNAAETERVDDADSAERAQGAGTSRCDEPAAVEAPERALRAQADGRHEDADEEVCDADAEQRFERVGQLRLSLMQQCAVRAPRQDGAQDEEWPFHDVDLVKTGMRSAGILSSQGGRCQSGATAAAEERKETECPKRHPLLVKTVPTSAAISSRTIRRFRSGRLTAS